MKLRVIIRPQVWDDLHEITEYIDESSVDADTRFATSFFSVIEDLAAMPGQGSQKRLRLRQLPGLRPWHVPGFPKHLILYQVAQDELIVWAVLHGARDLRAVLRGRL